MKFDWIEVAGFVAALASFYSFFTKTMIPLRIAAIFANVLFAFYWFMRGFHPAFALNAALVPLNLFRLRSMSKLVESVRQAARSDLRTDWLLPFMKEKKCLASEVLFTPDSTANEAYYIIDGEVELVEIAKSIGTGTLFGEMALFTPDHHRTLTARCKTDVRLGVITYDDFKQLYFQNPEFGFYLLRLIVLRMKDNVDFMHAQRGKAT
jgi:CRP-like cAMP-binding protein